MCCVGSRAEIVYITQCVVWVCRAEIVYITQCVVWGCRADIVYITQCVIINKDAGSGRLHNSM